MHSPRRLPVGALPSALLIGLAIVISIGYKPSNFTGDGKWRKIKVKVTPPRGLPRPFVRSKEGYYAIPGQR